MVLSRHVIVLCIKKMQEGIFLGLDTLKKWIVRSADIIVTFISPSSNCLASLMASLKPSDMAMATPDWVCGQPKWGIWVSYEAQVSMSFFLKCSWEFLGLSSEGANIWRAWFKNPCLDSTGARPSASTNVNAPAFFRDLGFLNMINLFLTTLNSFSWPACHGSCHQERASGFYCIGIFSAIPYLSFSDFSILFIFYSG